MLGGMAEGLRGEITRGEGREGECERCVDYVCHDSAVLAEHSTPIRGPAGWGPRRHAPGRGPRRGRNTTTNALPTTFHDCESRQHSTGKMNPSRTSTVHHGRHDTTRETREKQEGAPGKF